MFILVVLMTVAAFACCFVVINGVAVEMWAAISHSSVYR